MSLPSTPSKRLTLATTTTPTTSRIVAASSAVHSSPHYQTTRRHSLYGTEDRIVIDPGSRTWKVGFSGEGRPRDVFFGDGEDGQALWRLTRATNQLDREEEDRMLQVKLQDRLRSVFHDSLLTDPKSRRVIVIEHPLLPLYIKAMIARILFTNLQVPFVSFAPSHLLSLLAVGRITGLVLDCGHLESTVLPIFASRPLFHQLKTTPLAGARLTEHIRSLVLLFGKYIPPPSPAPAPRSVTATQRQTSVPAEILTDAVVEEIKTRVCLVGKAFELSAEDSRPSQQQSTTRYHASSDDDMIDVDHPSSDAAQSESEFSRVSMDVDSPAPGSRVASSSYSIVSGADSHGTSSSHTGEHGGSQVLADLYKRHSTASDIQMSVTPPAFSGGLGRGVLVIPGWIRERAAEVLFEGGDVDEVSVAEVILDSLLKVPVDLRKTMVSTILVVGGTPMIPGFIPRLHAEIARALSPPLSPQLQFSKQRKGRLRPPPYDRYAPLRQLLPHFAILDNPDPPKEKKDSGSAQKKPSAAGKAPAFTPACMAWVGGSLAGSLKTGGVDISREKWEESDTREEVETEDGAVTTVPPSPTSQVYNKILPDWTRGPLPVGAPAANTRVQAQA
ncbi:actin-like ATPase domain-containing protein, partial [Thelephora ganbajun]